MPTSFKASFICFLLRKAGPVELEEKLFAAIFRITIVVKYLQIFSKNELVNSCITL